jgi:hypothetical protein
LQWNAADHPKGELWTDELAREIQMEVLSSVKSVVSAMQKGMLSLPQYKSLTAYMYLSPSFHLKIGMTNNTVAVFADFVEEEVEQKSEAELDAARKVSAVEGEIVRVKLIREADVLAIKLAMQVTRKHSTGQEEAKNANKIEKKQLEAELKLANGSKKTLDDKLKAGAKTSNTAKENLVKLKPILQEFVAKRGSHCTSLVKAI